ncbi:FAD-linked oxidase [Microlunatus endophyticus]|uniref:FAD-linked oxidase n=1 Tax=Microlunatus endophyticus TaxID=1716077 RepID=A0A917S4L1_9ACTN|nr:FAD-linked oxidase C-terminal domain-containing protein [Microlunatus endophyticus]GGL57666.1 FAD-linked oxidase [Microlunatus endophyticus]
MSSAALPSLLDDLASLFRPDQLVTDPDVMESLAHDDAEWAPWVLPAVVVRAGSAADVQAVVRAAIRHGVPVVPRGSGTGLSGGANAVAGSIVIDLSRMNEIKIIDPTERLAVVGPGVINDDLRAAVAEQGLWYPPDPASSPWSSIGGNVATNAGGVCCVKYGVTRDYVLALEVVTGRGEIVRIGTQTAKGVAGYDLTSLLVGSEGTLGIVTEITVRLRRARPVEHTVVGYFDSITDAGLAVTRLAESGVVPSALELVDRKCLEAVDAWKNMGLSADANVILLGRTDAPGQAGAQEASAMVAAFEAGGATWSAQTDDPAEGDALFAARRLSYPALERLGPVLTEDICLPLRQVPAMLARIEAIAAEHETTIANIAHVGDGNLHPLLITPIGDEAARQRAQAAFADIIAGCLELGGTVTGEHGVGLLKLDGLAAELDPVVQRMQADVKAALDPYGILNPGKAIVSVPPRD